VAGRIDKQKNRGDVKKKEIAHNGATELGEGGHEKDLGQRLTESSDGKKKKLC